jgi:hypothetical protein
MDKIENINTAGNFYLVRDLETPEMERLLDRLGIDRLHMEAIRIIGQGQARSFFVSGKNIYPAPIPDRLEDILVRQIPVYKMSELEGHLSRLEKESSPAYFMTADTKRNDVPEQIRRLGLEYDYNAKDLAVREPLFLVFKNRAYACNSEGRRRELLEGFGLEAQVSGAPYHIKDLLAGQEADMELVKSRALSYIPLQRRTLPVCREAFSHKPMNIKDIPPWLLSPKFVSDIIETNPRSIRYIPAEKLDSEVCYLAVCRDSGAFMHLPGEWKTTRICDAAYSTACRETDDPAYLKDIIRAIPEANTHIALMGKYHRTFTAGEILKSLPENVMNRQICEKALSLQQEAIMDIPDKFKSETMALKAFDAGIYLLPGVPDRYKTKDLCVDAIIAASGDRDSYMILAGIPYPDIIADALKNDFKHIPVRDIVNHIPKEVMDGPFASLIIRRDASLLPEIPFRLKSEQVCLEAISGAGSMEPLYAIPYPAMTDKVCAALIDKFPQAMANILPEDKKTPELCLMAVKQDETLKKYVPGGIAGDTGMNIYRFGLLVDEQVMLDFKQVKDLYEGKKVEIDYRVPETQVSRKVQIQYNPEKMSLNYYYDSDQKAVKYEERQQDVTPGKRMKM